MTTGARSTQEVVVVGAGPNGLTAAVLLARAGFTVRVLEATPTIGGGCRSADVTLGGFTHDICAAVHPLAALSPVFREIGLEKFGLEWIGARRPLAHPLPDGSVGLLDRAIETTAQRLGSDGAAWARTIGPFANDAFIRSLLKPVWFPGGGSLLRQAQFGWLALRSCERLAGSRFDGEAARALFAGCAAHSVVALDRAGTASFGLVLAAAAHAVEWPVARGGSQAIANALVRALEEYGGKVEVGRRVYDLREFADARAILFDTSPRLVAEIAGDALPTGYRERLARFPHGPAVFKVDWALSRPIPWRNAECRESATVHVGGSFEEVLRSEHVMMAGEVCDRPFVLVAQPSLVDSTRAPAGRHTGWAYCHVPAACETDMTDRIESQVERFAPGFRDCILARHTLSPKQLQAHNPAMIGGDMAGGLNTLGRFLFRPVPRFDPYRTPNPRLFLCSSSTPPGAGVHGMCGYHAAHAVLRAIRR